MSGLGHLLWTILITAILCLPLAISVWALLDAARRPGWAWSLAERNQAMWLAGICLGFFTVVGGLAISGLYLWRGRAPDAPPRGGRAAGSPTSPDHRPHLTGRRNRAAAWARAA